MQEYHDKKLIKIKMKIRHYTINICFASKYEN